MKEYNIPKWRRTNQNMTIDLRPICEKGQRVTAGQILTEGYSTEDGELALGKNLLVVRFGIVEWLRLAVITVR